MRGGKSELICGGCELSIMSGMISELSVISECIVADRSFSKGVTCLWISFTALVSIGWGFEHHRTGGVIVGNGCCICCLDCGDCGKNS